MQYLCAYKGTHPGWQGLVNRGIRFATASKYSHTEIAIGNPFEAPALCVSSSGVDGGVRGKTMQLSPDKWDIFPVPWVSENDVLGFLSKYDKCGYDFFGVARFALPFLLREHKSLWFCSESSASILEFIEPWRYDPATLVTSVLSHDVITTRAAYVETFA